jgi:tetratricopeptide (TPR) repeat protein
MRSIRLHDAEGFGGRRAYSAFCPLPISQATITNESPMTWNSVAGWLSAALMSTLLLVSSAAAVDTVSDSKAPDLSAVRVKINAKDFVSARDDLLEIVKTNAHADVYNLLGFALRKSGDYKNALTYYKIALDYDRDHKGAHEYLGELYVETKEPEKAREHLVILTKLCPQGCEERADLEAAIRTAGFSISSN